MWNYSPDVMDALVELIIALVRGYLVLQARFYVRFLIILSY